MAEKICVFGERVMIKLEKCPDTYQGSTIIVPDSIKDSTLFETRGFIVELGDKVPSDCKVKVGDNNPKRDLTGKLIIIPTGITKVKKPL